jgi:hypothetical protein
VFLNASEYGVRCVYMGTLLAPPFTSCFAVAKDLSR